MSQAVRKPAGVTLAPVRGRRLVSVAGRGSKGPNATAVSASLSAESLATSGSLATNGDAGQIGCFVAGPENDYVAAVVNQLIQHITSQTSAHADTEPQTSFSPLPCPIVLAGASGSGKTHLARGLVELWRPSTGSVDPSNEHARKRDESIVGQQSEALYLTAADFRREYAVAIDRRDVRSFRRQLRRRRFLAIDDAHRLAESPYAAVELRHTIDAFNERDGILLLTMGGPAAERAPFDRPLSSRLAGGLSLEIAPPGREARREMLRQAATAVGCSLDKGALDALAEGLPAEPPRVLRAALQLRYEGGTRIDVQMAKRLLADDQPTTSPALRDILRVVARYHQIPLRVLTSASRKQSVVTARAVAIYLARELTPMTYTQIGQLLGGRDHTTVMHNYRRVTRELPKDRALRSAVDDLKRLLTPA